MDKAVLRSHERLMKVFSDDLVEGMEKDRIAKRIYVRECTGSDLVGRPR